MLGRIIASAALFMALNTTAAVAKTDKNRLVKLASKQEVLSQNITKAYKKQDKSSMVAIIKRLESGQSALKTHIHNPEISNMIVFLNMCIKDLKQTLKAPYNAANTEKVVELSSSISEGSHYIAMSI